MELPTTLAEAAEWYADHGVRILPIKPGDKVPLTEHGCKDASADPATVSAWWQRWPTANIGMSCAGMLALDVDGDENPWLAGLSQDQVDDLSKGAHQTTPRGGHHFIFKCENGSRQTASRIAPNVDTRDSGGYVVVAPSVVGGRPYEWWKGKPIDLSELPEPPAWLLEALSKPKVSAPAQSEIAASCPDDLEAVKRAIAYLFKCSPAISGDGGHAKTFEVARAIVWGFNLGQDVGFDLLAEHYNPRCEPPWSEAELRHKCKDADEKPFDKPRGWLLAERPSTEETVVGSVDTSQTSPTIQAANEPEIFTAAELMQMDLPEPEWAIPEIVPAGLTILAGAPKCGKSWLSLDWGIAIANGEAAMGAVHPEQGEVLYIALEDHKRRLKKRVLALKPDGDGPKNLHFSTKWPRWNIGGKEALIKWLANHPGVRMVIIDTLAKIRPVATGKQKNLYETDYNDIAEIKELADHFNIAVVLIHHTRKAESSDPLQEVSGTLALSGAADTILALKRDRCQDVGELFITGRDVEEQSLAARFDQEDCRWQLIGRAEAVQSKEKAKREKAEAKAQAGYEEIKARVMAAIPEVDPGRTGFTINQIREFTGINGKKLTKEFFAELVAEKLLVASLVKITLKDGKTRRMDGFRSLVGLVGL